MNTPTPGWTNAATVSLEGLKVTLSQPVCVARSTNWLWFPEVYRLPNGDLVALMSTAYDGDPSDTAAAAAWSSDGGLTWSELQPSPVVSYGILTLTNGNTLLLPYFLQLQGQNDLVGPCGVISNGTRSIVRRENAVTVTNWPRPVRRQAVSGCRMVFNGQTLRLTNGLYFATLYGWFEGANRYNLVAATSPDGFHWSVQSVIADDACPLPGAEGPCEATTVRLADGRLMVVFRLGGYVDKESVLYGQSWSSDEGRTWTAPINMAGPKSVEPSMIAMPSGVVALSGGRPGLWVWLDRKGDGQTWQRVDIRAHHNRCVPAEPISESEGWDHQTSAYTELAMLDATNLLLIYDRIPNGHVHLPPPGVSNSIWVVRVTIERSGASQKMNPTARTATDFALEALVDFPDDALIAGRAITPAHVDAMMAELKRLGIRRVSWGWYGDGMGDMRIPTGYSEDYLGGWQHYADTCRALGGNPLKVAVEAGHRHGLEVYAYFKPYETGPGLLFPEGSPQAKTMGLLDHAGGKLGWVLPLVIEHPELRIKRRTDDLPLGVDQAVITAIRLIKRDDTPTRITAERLQIWTSPDNWQYKRKDIGFDFTETVGPAPCDFRDHNGTVLTPAGRPVRVLTLSGFRLTDKYILVTTDFTEGQPDFVNVGTKIVQAVDERGRVIPITVANGGYVWCGGLMDFRNGGVNYDWAWDDMPVTLDAPNANGRQGFIAFMRGRPLYLCGALCETEPAVQAFWLKCLDTMIAAGVDGVDIREENHSMMTDLPEDYGFNDVILRQCGDLRGQALLDRISKVRGDAYTEFLRACKQRLAARGLKLRYNLQVDWFRPDRPRNRACAYPANLEWQWQRWLDEGLLDEAVLRSYSIRHHGEPLETVLHDAVTADMAKRCAAKGVPLAFNRYISASGGKLVEDLRRVRADGRFSGFIFYETYDFIRFNAEGGATVSLEQVKEAAAAQ